MRATAILTVRNEGAFVLEWIAHHMCVGFTDILVYSNDCEDGTDAILDRLDALGHVRHERNPGPYDKGGIQFTALKAAAGHDAVQGADWILPLDIDEFVNIHVGAGRLADLIGALPDADAITLTWRLFGNNDQARYRDAPITETFTRAAPDIMHWPWRSAMFKTLYRNAGIYRMPGVHRPRDPDPERVGAARWFDGHGRPLEDQFRTRRVFSQYGRPNYGLVQLNHYALGSMESYVLKAARGRAVHSADMLGLDYWVERNFNQVEDTTINRYSDSRSELLQELHEDTELNRLHAAAVAWRHAQFGALLQQEPFRALFGRLLMTPPSRVVSPNAGHFLRQHAAQAHAASEPAAQQT